MTPFVVGFLTGMACGSMLMLVLIAILVASKEADQRSK